MPAPAAAVAHQAPMSPFDRVEYVTLFATLLEDGETIASAQMTLYPEAVALGFTILESADFGPAIINNNAIRIWVEVDETMRGQAAFVAGARMPVEFLIITSATPFRRFKRTMTIMVANL